MLWFGKPKAVSRRCTDCQHYKTMGCPNSSECYSLEDKPHYKVKQKVKCKTQFSNNVVVLSVVSVSWFTTACLILIAIGAIEQPSDTLITAWFTFWGTEVLALTSIKHKKIKHNYVKQQEDEGNDN